MLGQRQRPRQLAFHRRKRAFDDFARALDLADGMGRFELHPIRAIRLFHRDAGVSAVSAMPPLTALRA